MQLIVLLVCGLPGSGKSTISHQLEEFGWVRINQDDLFTAEECRKKMEKALKHKKSVVVDRVNVHPKERKMWLNYAKTYTNHFEVLFLDLPQQLCIDRVRERKNHPTLPPENAERVIEDFLKGFSIPNDWEGPYQKVMIPKSPEEVKEHIKQLKEYSVNTKKVKM